MPSKKHDIATGAAAPHPGDNVLSGHSIARSDDVRVASGAASGTSMSAPTFTSSTAAVPGSNPSSVPVITLGKTSFASMGPMTKKQPPAASTPSASGSAPGMPATTTSTTTAASAIVPASVRPPALPAAGRSAASASSSAARSINSVASDQAGAPAPSSSSLLPSLSSSAVSITLVPDQGQHLSYHSLHGDGDGPASAAISGDGSSHPAPGGRRQIDSRLPENCFLHILTFLAPEQTARCMSVSLRWRALAGDEKLWMAICKAAIQRFHPDLQKDKERQALLDRELQRAGMLRRKAPHVDVARSGRTSGASGADGGDGGGDAPRPRRGSDRAPGAGGSGHTAEVAQQRHAIQQHGDKADIGASVSNDPAASAMPPSAAGAEPGASSSTTDSPTVSPLQPLLPQTTRQPILAHYEPSRHTTASTAPAPIGDGDDRHPHHSPASTGTSSGNARGGSHSHGRVSSHGKAAPGLPSDVAVGAADAHVVPTRRARRDADAENLAAAIAESLAETSGGIASGGSEGGGGSGSGAAGDGARQSSARLAVDTAAAVASSLSSASSASTGYVHRTSESGNDGDVVDDGDYVDGRGGASAGAAMPAAPAASGAGTVLVHAASNDIAVSAVGVEAGVAGAARDGLVDDAAGTENGGNDHHDGDGEDTSDSDDDEDVSIDAADVVAGIAAAGAAGGGPVSLSVIRSQYLRSRRQAKQVLQAERERVAAIRAETVATFRSLASSLRSYRLAYRHIPTIKCHGVYCLHASYVRKGVQDMFHKVNGILKCVYHRTFYFREDGSLLYAMMPGQPFEAVREFRRIIGTITNASNVNGDALLAAGTTADAASSPPSLALVSTSPTGSSPPASSPHSLKRSSVLALNTKDQSSTIGKGWWRLEGSVLKCEVVTANNIVTRWVCEVGSSSDIDSIQNPHRHYGHNNRLTVVSLHLIEPGADPDTAAVLLSSLNGEVMEWRNLAVV